MYNANDMHGLPVGVQVVGRRLEEEKVMEGMKIIERLLKQEGKGYELIPFWRSLMCSDSRMYDALSIFDTESNSHTSSRKPMTHLAIISSAGPLLGALPCIPHITMRVDCPTRSPNINEAWRMNELEWVLADTGVQKPAREHLFRQADIHTYLYIGGLCFCSVCSVMVLIFVPPLKADWVWFFLSFDLSMLSSSTIVFNPGDNIIASAPRADAGRRIIAISLERSFYYYLVGEDDADLHIIYLSNVAMSEGRRNSARQVDQASFLSATMTINLRE